MRAGGLVVVGVGARRGASKAEIGAAVDTVLAETGLAEAGPADAGPADAGPAAAGPADAGPADAGPAAAGPADAGLAAAGPAEAGPAGVGPAGVGVGGGDVTVLATLDRRAREPAVRELALDRGWRLAGVSAAELARQEVPHPSAAVAGAVGTPSVAEAAALCAAGAGAELIVTKRVFPRVTVAIARGLPGVIPDS